MGISGPCPLCGASPGAPAERPAEPMGQAVDALYQEVALIRKAAEASANQSEEIRMLRETVARLRGSSVAAAQYAGLSTSQHASAPHGKRGSRAAHHPASASTLSPSSRSSSAA